MITKKDLKKCDIEQPYILISYSSKDKNQVFSDVYALQKKGYNIWIDDKMVDKKERSWHEQVRTYINNFNCCMVLFYVSKNSLISDQCYKEIKHTTNEEVELVHNGPVRLVIIDVEPINNIIEYKDKIRKEIGRSNISGNNKTQQASVLGHFIREVFNDNNDRIRIQSKNCPERKAEDYYADIEEFLPEESLQVKEANEEKITYKKFDTKIVLNSGDQEEIVKNVEESNAQPHSKEKVIEEKKPENSRIAAQPHSQKTAKVSKSPARLPKIGESILFGRYPQTADGTVQPIEWRVLDTKENGQVLLLSKYALDCKQYNTKFEEVTWDRCTLRDWLNQDFYQTAFSDSEQKRIAVTLVTADKNPDYDTYPGEDKPNKVFLLSIQEARKYLCSNKERECKATVYAEFRGAWNSIVDGTCDWWLRSPGFSPRFAVRVSSDGDVYSFGFDVYFATVGVRPALWVNLES